MNDDKTQQADYNPLNPDTFSHGGGLWDGKTVTITSAAARRQPLTYGDGTAVIDAKTKEQSILNALFITGIADGGDDRERHEEYSVGDKCVPTPDSEGFTALEGGLPKFHANSNMGKFAAALKASGFDISTLLVAGKLKFSNLVGARFVMKGEPKIGRDGKPVTDKKGYGKNAHYPVKFVGYTTAAATGAKPNGGVGGDALRTKAAGAVVKALAGGPLSRADLVRTLAQTLAGDPESNSIIGLVIRDDFHAGQPWKYDGITVSL